MKTILIVDDSDLQKKIVIEMVQQIGTFNIVTASDYETGLTQFGLKKPDLVLMDIMLPGKSGIELTKAIKKKDKDANVIVTTSLSLNEFESQLNKMKLPKVDQKENEMHPVYMTKPLKLPDMIQVFKNLGIL